MDKVLYLFVGGGLGSLVRHGLSRFIHSVFGMSFPYGTLCVNLAGCFLAGLLLVLTEEKALLSHNAQLFFMVGFLGALTTFSTFMLETADLIRGGNTMLAFGNVMLSVIAGFFVFKLGVMMVKV